MGTCRLCEAQNVEIRWSHILPHFGYKRVRARNPGAALERIDELRKPKSSTKELAEYMLGDCCEKRMKVWEDVVKHLVRQPSGAVPARDNLLWHQSAPTCKRAVIATLARPEDVAMFAFSVVWRAHASGITTVQLGDHADEFAAALLEGRAVTGARCVVSVVPGPFDEVIMEPHQLSDGADSRYVVFGVAGLVFYVFWGRLQAGSDIARWASDHDLQNGFIAWEQLTELESRLRELWGLS